MAQPELFECGCKIVASENSLFGRQDELRAYRGCFFLAELHLMLKFSQGRQAHAKNISEHSSAKAQHDNQHNRKATIHSFPLPLAKLAGSLHLAAQRPPTASASNADYHEHFCTKPRLRSNANPTPCVQSRNLQSRL